MSTNNHTPYPFGGPLTSAAMEAPLGQLDAAIASVIATGSGTSTTLTAQALAGQASLTVASSAGFAVGDPIYVGTGATFESRIVATVPNATTITVTVNLTNTYAIGQPVSKSPVEIVDARGGFTSLGGRIKLIEDRVFDAKRYGATALGAADDRPAIQAAIDAAIVAGGTVYLPPGAYRITAPLDFSAAKGTLRAVRMVGSGAGSVNSGSGATTTILNDSTGTAIKAFGTVAGATIQGIAGLELSGFMVKNLQNLGTNYTIDLDYVIGMFRLADLFVWGQNFTGGGIQVRNFGHGQSTIDRVTCREFRSGTGFRLAVEVTANVDVAPNSGNIALVACSAIDVLKGYHIVGTNLLNSGSLVACKAVNVSDVVGSVGFHLGTNAKGWSLVSPHAERFSTGYWLDTAEYNSLLSPFTGFPTGVPDALSAGIRMTGSATGNVATGALLQQTHYGVRFEGTARTNSVMGSDRTGARVLTAWSSDVSTNGSNHVLKAEDEAPFLWKMGGPSQVAMGKLGVTNAISPTQLTATVQNWAPTGLASAGVIRIAASAAWSIGGIVAGQPGDTITLCNISAFTITLVHGDVGSTAANEILCPGNANLALGLSSAATLWYDGTSSRWRVIR